MSDNKAFLSLALEDVGIIAPLAAIICDYALGWRFNTNAKTPTPINYSDDARTASANDFGPTGGSQARFIDIITVCAHTSWPLYPSGKHSITFDFDCPGNDLWVGLSTRDENQAIVLPPPVFWLSDGAKLAPKKLDKLVFEDLVVGDFVDSRDWDTSWHHTRVDKVGPDPGFIFVHNLGWRSEFDEYIAGYTAPNRLAPSGTHTDISFARYGTKWDELPRAQVTMEIDFDEDTVSFALDGVSQGVAYQGLNLKAMPPLFPVVRLPYFRADGKSNLSVSIV